MSEKTRRQKDIITNATTSYLAATDAYQNYLDNASEIYITYYQISDESSRTDTSLEDAHEVVGKNSSIYYYAIKHLPARGTSTLDISTQLTQRGLESFISGEFVLTPDTNINPRAGEFFKFEDENNPELESHLFQITDVQYDKAISQKYFKVSYKLYPKDTDNIFSKVIKKYIYDPSGKGNTDGVGNGSLITEETAAKKESLNNLIDGLINTYTDTFYDQGMNTFVWQHSLDSSGANFEYFWSPYLCHFIYKNKLMEKTNPDFLTEFYVEDYTESSHPGIYNERAYRKSLFYAVEMDDPKIINKIESSFMEVSSYNLNKPLNLPFFSSASKYYLVDLKHQYNQDFWLGAFNWVYDEPADTYIELNGDYKYTGELGNHLVKCNLITEDGDIADTNKLLKPFYQLASANNQFEIKNIWTFGVKSSDGEDSLEPYKCDLYDILNNSTKPILDEDHYLFSVIRDYLNGKLSLTEETLTKINNHYFDNSFRTYVLLPIIIYILQNYTFEEEN